MQQPMQPILQHLFQVSSLDDLSRQRLEAFVEEHPSFGIGHYLLSRKLKAEASDEYAKETQKTSLYFTNPFWLQWQLDNVALAGGHFEQVVAAEPVKREEPVYAAASPEAPVEPVLAAMPVESVLAAPPAEPILAEPPAEPILAEPPAEPILVESPAEPAFAEAPAELAEHAPAEALAEHAPAEAPAEPEEPVYAAVNVVAVAEESFELPSGDHPAEALSAGATDTQESSAADKLLRSIEEARGLRQSLDKINTGFDAETGIAGETASVDLQPAVEAEPAAAAIQPTIEAPIHDEEPPFVLDEAAKLQPELEAKPIQDEEPPFVLEETEAPPVVVTTPEPVAQPEPEAAVQPEPEAAIQPEPEATHQPEPEAAAQPEPESEPIAQTQPEPITTPETHSPALPAQPAGTDFVFEPYHTVDYFASQGIKFTLEENPSDTLGKQLKSFTEWLKGMRRLPQKGREVVPDRVAEEAVQTKAAHSIEGRDVLTETMAEVLAKQGMRERARAVYEKLSLLNPDKRAYFAAKIEQLNIL
jgi:hypothetical protein